MKKYFVLILIICTVLSGCKGAVTQSVSRDPSTVTYKSNAIMADQEIAVFYIRVKNGEHIVIPYTFTDKDDAPVKLKVGLRNSETLNYDNGDPVSSNTHSFVYKKDLKSSRDGKIEFTAKKAGNYAIILGNGEENKHEEQLHNEIVFEAKLPN